MLAKEKRYSGAGNPKNLKERNQVSRIVETAIEGILVFDEQYRITFANNNMAAMPYTVDDARQVVCFLSQTTNRRLQSRNPSEKGKIRFMNAACFERTGNAAGFGLRKGDFGRFRQV